jgi:RNA polymerase sigma-70 factor (ECF subfamily)
MERASELDRDLAALADGDRSAFQPVFRAVWPVVYRFAERTLGSAADAEDVAQRALLRVFERAVRYDPARPALPFILGIAANECRAARRRAHARRELAVADAPERADPARDPEEASIERDLVEAAAAVLGALRREDMDTILAAVGASERPAVPGATFRKRLSRAVGRLRQAWSARHDP